jgi:hypothetical protein
MSTRRLTLAALLALPLALAGCKINTINSFPTVSAHVRAVNVVTGTTAVDVLVEDAATWPGLAFEGSTDYVDLDNKQTTFNVRLQGETALLVTGTFSLAGEQTYTLVTYGTPTQPLLLLLPDATIQPGSGRSQLRIVNTATGIGAVDAYLTAPGIALDTIGPQFAGIGYSGATTYLQFAPGTYQLRITTSGTKDVIYDSGAIDFSDNTSTDLLAYATTSGRLMNALLLDVNGAGQRRVARNTLAQVKFVNAAVQAGAVNALVDGTALFTNLGVALPTGYSTVAAGTRAITFEAAATPGVPIASVSPSLAAASDSTVIVTGLAGSTHAVVLADNNVPPNPGNARFRFVNSSIGVGPLDVLVNNVKQAPAIAQDSASGYMELASGTYTIAFADAATGTVVLTISEVSATDGTTNSVFAIGTAGALVGAVTQDDSP